MGMFTSVMHPGTGDEIQFKCGYDDCDWYAVGQEVDWRYDPGEPLCGKLLDGAYDGESFYLEHDAARIVHTGHWWVVIKDHKVVAVEPVVLLADVLARTRARVPLPEGSPEHAEREAYFGRLAENWGVYHGGYAAQMAHVEAKHGVELPPLDAWTTEAWANKARRAEESRRRLRQWDVEDYGLWPEERAVRGVNRFTRLMMSEGGFAHKVFPPVGDGGPK